MRSGNATKQPVLPLLAKLLLFLSLASKADDESVGPARWMSLSGLWAGYFSTYFFGVVGVFGDSSIHFFHSACSLSGEVASGSAVKLGRCLVGVVGK